jgi:hypothetical protein
MSKPIAISIVDAMNAPKLFGDFFAGESWNMWRAVLRAAFGEAMSDAERAAFRTVADREPPAHRVSEACFIVGRGGGKDSAASLIASHIAMTFDPKGKLRPGEVATIMCIAVDREQANIVLNYIKAYFETVPALAALVKSIDRDGVTLRNGVAIEVHTNSFRSVRGRTIIAAIFDEVAFWRSEDSAVPDVEVAGAVQPGLARMKDSMLILISTVHKRSGLLYEKWKGHYGKPDDDVLVVRGTTQQFNPTFDAKTIARQIASDPQLYGAEYNSQWRDDLSSYISRELLEAAIDHGVVVRPPQPEITYYSFADPSGGAHDSFTAAIAHREKGDIVLLDMLYERRPPFNPSEVVQEIATTLQDYGLSKITGDKYAAQWVVEAFDKCGVRYEQSERDRSQIYLDTLPLFTAGQARLIDNARLIGQFAQLERRVFSSGKDRVDHGRAGHDDLCNSAAGAMILASRRGAYDSTMAWVGDVPATDKTPDGQPRFCQGPQSIFQHPIFNGGVRRW